MSQDLPKIRKSVSIYCRSAPDELTMKCPHQRGRLSMTICLLGTKQVSVVRILTGVCIKRVEFRE